ncbi:DNA integrity scanning diadenylate cyclase DisA [Glutamicibacter endophyticus]|uniref:DNA integrity scanning diadenylate cyclase DisA n=1 Tax=Glutamicibacter sp. PS TaxID=3075634 RepID=UPI0028523BC3|nr:DNA integrity scanning diadenylate cyclase DisA [Glutamicibacter sp. PS]MDR4534804.1 DNA integrity scanning diadenylate cyclase DisA [Glutamicibacter sp. PS]
MKLQPAPQLLSTLARIAPGTELAEGLERIQRGRTGGLIVLGHDRQVESICSGGFRINAEFTPTRLRELAKMDGAIITDSTGRQILQAGVQLMPDASIETQESGTRHRTAERVALQTGFPVISVSQSMHTITLYAAGERHVLETAERLLARGNQAVATLERYRHRLDQVTSALSAAEIEDVATVREVLAVLQRTEMLRRTSEEISRYVLELGVDGRLLAAQHAELLSGIHTDSQLLLRDYSHADGAELDIDAALAKLHEVHDSELIEPESLLKVLFPSRTASLDEPLTPKGYRLLAQIRSVPKLIGERLVAAFGDLQLLMAATTAQLMEIEGVGEQRARSIREGLARMAESSLLERYI